eukprot:6458201-Alexandrium_andersonii.AAC.1
MKSTALVAPMVAGLLERSGKIAQSWLESHTWFPWNTTLPLYFRRGRPLGSSWFFSTQISKMRPT